jgi:hypothetical protein
VTRPRFSNVDAVTRWVYNDCRAKLLDAMELFDDGTGVYSSLPPDAEPSDEQMAVEAATRGDPSKLADLIDAWVTVRDQRIEPNPVEIAPATWKLVVEFLRGKRSLTTGRHRDDEQRGRPRMSVEERFRQTPTHDAALEFPAVKLVLKAEYPDHARYIHQRALDVVARRHNVDRNTLAEHLNRGRRARQRIR